MTWIIKVTEAAAEDAILIHDWYEIQQSDLGIKFTSALGSVRSKLLSNPFAFRIWKKNIRRIVLSPFAYKMYYKIYEEKIVYSLLLMKADRTSF